MGILSKLFSAISRKSVRTSQSSEEAKREDNQEKIANLEVWEGFLSIDAANFFGKAYVSPNKQWVLGCSDFDGKSRGGNRDSGNGRVLLVEMTTNSIAHELKSISRPVAAAVADSGSYVLNDCGFGMALSGLVQAFNSKGEKQYSRQYTANVYSVGISNCGRFIAVQTCNAPKSPDSCLFEVHDVTSKTCLFSIPPVAPWSMNYTFDTTGDAQLKKLWVHDEKLGRFAYSAAGEFLDAKRLQTARIMKGDAYTRLQAVEHLLKNPEGQSGFEIALNVASEIAIDAKQGADHSYVPKAHRLRGEALEALGRASEAIEAYEEALARDPKIGVKKRLEALKKRISAG